MANKYQVTRFEQHVQYWWNGTTFTTKEADRKLFDSTEAADTELADKKAHYFDHDAGRWVGRPIQVTPAK